MSSPVESGFLPAMGTGPSQSAVSNLDFELRKVHEFQNSSRGVMAKAITPPPQQAKITFDLRLM